MADVPRAEAEMPLLEYGETDESPRPAPNARRIKESAAVTAAPAITADQETPEEWASLCSTWPE
jgi:hypothetical protein